MSKVNVENFQQERPMCKTLSSGDVFYSRMREFRLYYDMTFFKILFRNDNIM